MQLPLILFSVEKLEYGLLILLAELFIGSKGYLFSYDYGGTLISLRMALFLVVMSAWLGKVVLDWIDVSKAPKIELEPWMKRGNAKSIYFYYSLLLGIRFFGKFTDNKGGQDKTRNH